MTSQKAPCDKSGLVKQEVGRGKANIGVEKELLSLDREKMKTAQAFAQPVKEGK